MNTFGGKISGDYGWEISVFHKVRRAADGVSFFDLKINWDRFPAYHSPRIDFHIVVLNWTVIEMSLYYLHHRDDG